MVLSFSYRFFFSCPLFVLTLVTVTINVGTMVSGMGIEMVLCGMGMRQWVCEIMIWNKTEMEWNINTDQQNGNGTYLINWIETSLFTV